MQSKDLLSPGVHNGVSGNSPGATGRGRNAFTRLWSRTRHRGSFDSVTASRSEAVNYAQDDRAGWIRHPYRERFGAVEERPFMAALG